jgi:hypothetical protein
MHTIQTPGPFSPAFGEILYTLSLDEAEKGEEISIFNSAVTEKIGIKKATEAPEFTLNVSDYVRSQIQIEPFPAQDSGIIDAHGRVWNSCIAYRDWASTHPHTAGIVPVGMNEPMCERPIRRLADNEQDEICWVAGEGNVFARALFPVEGTDAVEIHLGRREMSAPGMLALILNSRHLDTLLQQRGMKWEYFREFTVEIHADYQPMARFEYRIPPHNCGKIRFAWWNRHGAIDHYSFESLQKEEITVSKRQIEAGDRKWNLSAQSRKTGVAATACSTRSHSEWLAGMAAAPRVWVACGERYVPVEITDPKITTWDPEHPEIEIHFEYGNLTEFQSF